METLSKSQKRRMRQKAQRTHNVRLSEVNLRATDFMMHKDTFRCFKDGGGGQRFGQSFTKSDMENLNTGSQRFGIEGDVRIIKL